MLIKVSVITPAYNAAQTIRLCVDSIRSQTFIDWEHIIVDDGSTDDTWQLLIELSEIEPRIKVIKQSNTGRGPARNVAIAASRGEYIALLDADDWSLPERLQLQVDFLDSHLEVDVLGGGIINISEDGNELGLSRQPSTHDELAGEIYKRNPFYTSTVMARRKFFIDLGGFRDLPRSQDLDLWFRGYQKFYYNNLDVPLAYYKRSPKNSWTNAFYSSKVKFSALKRDKKTWTYFWYCIRPFIGVIINKFKKIKITNYRI